MKKPSSSVCNSAEPYPASHTEDRNKWCSVRLDQVLRIQDKGSYGLLGRLAIERSLGRLFIGTIRPIYGWLSIPSESLERGHSATAFAIRYHYVLSYYPPCLALAYFPSLLQIPMNRA